MLIAEELLLDAVAVTKREEKIKTGSDIKTIFRDVEWHLPSMYDIYTGQS